MTPLRLLSSLPIALARGGCLNWSHGHLGLAVPTSSGLQLQGDSFGTVTGEACFSRFEQRINLSIAAALAKEPRANLLTDVRIEAHSAPDGQICYTATGTALYASE